MADSISQYKKELQALDKSLANAANNYEYQARIKSNLQNHTGQVSPGNEAQRQRLRQILNNKQVIAGCVAEARGFIASALKELDKVSNNIGTIKSNIKSAKSIEKDNVWGSSIDRKNNNNFKSLDKNIKSISK